MTKHTQFRPLLAATIESDNDLQSLRYPMIASPKVDGIRIQIHPTIGPRTRSLKPVKNEFISDYLRRHATSGFDGEITVGPMNAKDMFQRTTSGVMSLEGEPDFTYHVFDDVDLLTAEAPYTARLNSASQRVAKLASPRIKLLESKWVRSVEEVSAAEIEWLQAGFEGIMLRSRHGPYKFGRSTLKEQILLKLKRWQDDEARIIGFEPLLRNQNAPTRNALGLQERSDHKDGKFKDSLLGNLIVEHLSFGRFSVGSGLDTELRTHIWNNQQDYLGKQITFKYQKVGIKGGGLPRFPIFLRFRPAE